MGDPVVVARRRYRFKDFNRKGGKDPQKAAKIKTGNIKDRQY